MKKIGVLLLSMIVILGACNKYEDGLYLSLRTKKHRAVNKWVINQVLENGVDKTTDYKTYYANYVLEIRDDNRYFIDYSAFSLTPYSEIGDWNFNNDHTQIIFINLANTASAMGSVWTILRLKEDELWGKTTNTSNGNVIEAHFTPKP